MSVAVPKPRVLGMRFRRCLGVAMLVGTATLSHPAAATTTLTVDLSSTIRPVTHAAVGSLYGVIEKLPADVNGLIAPLHPNVLTNPAAVGSDKQQPVGDAIVVAGRVAPIGAKVTIRLADWFPGWYLGYVPSPATNEATTFAARFCLSRWDWPGRHAHHLRRHGISQRPHLPVARACPGAAWAGRAIRRAGGKAPDRDHGADPAFAG